MSSLTQIQRTAYGAIPVPQSLPERLAGELSGLEPQERTERLTALQGQNPNLGRRVEQELVRREQEAEQSKSQVDKLAETLRLMTPDQRAARIREIERIRPGLAADLQRKLNLPQVPTSEPVAVEPHRGSLINFLA